MFFFLMILPLLFTACDDDDDNDQDIESISALTFIGEQLIPDGMMFDGEVVGGLSSIDYANGTYYLISDAASAPIRFYTADLSFDENSFDKVDILSQVELKDVDGSSFADAGADPEAIRFDPELNQLVWTSEGYVDDRAVDPFIRVAATNGDYVRSFDVPTMFKATAESEKGPRLNGSFEGLSLSQNGKGYWASMELPLVQDGATPDFGVDTDSPVRICYIDRETGTFGRQFVYELGPVVRDGGFKVNGIVEVLEYTQDQFLVLERSFSTGYDDGGNNVLIYKVDASSATDVSGMESLESASYTAATKTLLFDFEDIRSELSAVEGTTAKVVDNIEGMTFGPELPNGKFPLVLVADNNFSAFGAQLNQFIVLEIQP